MFTATIPYAIIVLMFIRGVTLDGAGIGLDFYLFKPQMSAIYDKDTWRRGNLYSIHTNTETSAATHVCYSLAIGFGGLLSLSSFNSHHHNCFKDAFLITIADGFMSMFGG